MEKDVSRSISKGLDWLIRQQDADGGWHSKTYGQLKDGASVTALALYAAGFCSEALRTVHAAAMKRGFAFLDRGLAKSGAIASPDGSLDFPTYAAALWLSTVNRLGLPANSQPVVKYLLGAQVSETRGFQKNSPSYGGWDFLGPKDAHGITTGTNISVTRYVLESLAAQQVLNQNNEPSGRDMESLEEAVCGPGKAYVVRCQQADGGFAFTCEPASLNNKAAYSDQELTKPRSYGTATCDGILALIACQKAKATPAGSDAEEPRISKAIAWLMKRPGLELVPGFEGLRAEDGWDRGLRYYYYAALSQVLPHFPPTERASRQTSLAQHLVALQRKDGSWVNESDRMRENDPLIATPLALIAVASLIAD